MKYNDFQTDLEYSLESGEDKLFNNFYYRVFPNIKQIHTVSDEMLQKKGIDKKIEFESGKIVLIDEKKRHKDYGDILLEEYSNWERKKVGWLGRDKHTDYIVYAVMPSKKVYLLPFLLLQKAWIKNYRRWIKAFGRKFSNNIYYKTSNVPVPPDILLKAIESTSKESLCG